MGRTTSDKKGKTVILRINRELDEKLKKESAEEELSVSEYCRRILEGKKECNTELQGIETLKEENTVLQNRIKELESKGVIQNTDGFPQLMNADTYRDIENMCRLSGLTFTNFMNHIQRLFNDGYIYIEGVAVKTKGDYDLSYLLDACHRANVDPQEMINKLANSLVRR